MKVFEVGPEGIGIFNAIAIGLGVEIISGRFKSLKYQPFLDEFAKYHPNFKPATWVRLREWINYYNNPRDLELILAPVLFNLNQVYRAQQDGAALVLEELAQLIYKNKNIDDVTPWSNLKFTNLFPELDALPIEVRKLILTDLTLILVAYNGTTFDDAKAFLSKQDEMLKRIADHIDLTKANYQRGYDNGNLMLKSCLFKNDANINIRVYTRDISDGERAGQRVWVASTRNYDEDLLEDSNARRFAEHLITEATSLGYKPEIPDFTAEQLVAHKAQLIKTERRMVDNPGAGNCGFYAFAIGLIYIIQREDSKLSPMFNQWSGVVPNLTQYISGADGIEHMHKLLLSFDYQSNEVNTKLLNYLQMGLRNCLYDNRVSELKLACEQPGKDNNNILANSTYLDFAVLFTGANQSVNGEVENNIFAGYPELVKQINEACAAIKASAAVSNPDDDLDKKLGAESVACFIRSLYGAHATLENITDKDKFDPNLPAVQALAKIKQNKIWATAHDLIALASKFNLNFYLLENGIPQQPEKFESNLPQITLNNIRNMHWVTQISEQRPFSSAFNSIVSPVKKPRAINESVSDTTDTVTKDKCRTEPRANTASTATKKNKALDAPLIMSQNNDDNLQHLKTKLIAATSEYTSYSAGIWFSLFHHHGQAGRARAVEFRNRFNDENNYDEARQELWDFLRNPANGNTHPHSYRTIILHKLLADAYPKHSLQDTSRNYAKLLDELAVSLDPYPVLKL